MLSVRHADVEHVQRIDDRHSTVMTIRSANYRQMEGVDFSKTTGHFTTPTCPLRFSPTLLHEDAE